MTLADGGERLQDYFNDGLGYRLTSSIGHKVVDRSFYRPVVVADVLITTITACRVLDNGEEIKEGDYKSFNGSAIITVTDNMIGTNVCTWNAGYKIYRIVD